MTGRKESPPEVTKKPTPPHETLVEQYRIAVELYRHEDSLNWTKLNNLFYVNAGLWAAVGFIIEFGSAENGPSPIDLRFFMGIVSVIGMIVCVALGVALWSGVYYMRNRKDAAIDIEEALKPYGGKDIVSPQPSHRRKRGRRILRWILTKSPTTWVLRLVPIAFLIVWLVVFWVNM